MANNERPEREKPSTSADEHDVELSQCLTLLTSLHLARPGDLRRGAPPEPDVIFTHPVSRQVIGLEITAIHPSGGDLRRHEEEANRIVEEARRRFEAAGNPKLLVSVFWSHTARIQKKDREPLISALIQAVLENLPTQESRREVDQCDDPRPNLPSVIDRIVISRIPEVTPEISGHWQCPRAIYVPDIQANDIEEALARKNPKPKNYRGGYDQRWLLIVASDAGPSTWGLIKPELNAFEFVSSYDRLFLMSRLNIGLVELRARTVQ